MRSRLVFAVAAPALMMTAVALVPHEADTDVSTVQEATDQLTVVASHQPATYIGFICLALGLAAVGGFGWQLSRAATGRGRLVALIGGGLVLIGGVAAGLANLVLGVLQTSAAQPGIDRAAAADQLVQTEAGAILAPYFLPYILGLIGGGLVLTVGLLITRPVPWWLGLVVGASIVALFFGNTGPSGVVIVLIMAAAFVAAARWPMGRTSQPDAAVQLDGAPV